jgi:hypothetical protein
MSTPHPESPAEGPDPDDPSTQPDNPVERDDSAVPPKPAGGPDGAPEVPDDPHDHVAPI